VRVWRWNNIEVARNSKSEEGLNGFEGGKTKRIDIQPSDQDLEAC